ncbi:MAG TPA: PKD domain-containing protein [Saprospiraceae bacterium]|nr:PKD domain-containing protein [Saprospiraceae bacterium]
MKKIYFFTLFLLCFLNIKVEAQVNNLTINSKVSDTNGSLMINYPVTVYRDNQTIKLLTDKNGIATDISDLKSNVPQEIKVSVEDPCKAVPQVQIVKPAPGVVNLSFVICAKIDTTKNCKVKFDVVGANPNSNTFTFIAVPDNPGATYSWSFGDGSSGTGSSITHTYAGPGIYEVTVKMLTNSCYAVFTDKVEVKGITPPPPSSMVCECCATMKLTPSNAKNIFIFSGDAGFKVPEFHWNVDGVDMTGQEVKYFFQKPGKYKATMEAKGEECDVIINKTIIIPDDSTNTAGNNDCKIDFSYLLSSPGTLIVYFKPLTDPSLQAKLIWNFGDGTSSTDVNPKHEYLKPGIYKVTLEVFYSNGKSCSVTKEVNIQKVKINTGPTSLNIIVSEIFPNPPTTNFVTLNIHSDYTQQVQITLYDSNGNIQKQLNADLNIGDNSIIIDISNLKPGVYVLVVSVNGKSVNTQKLIIK